MAEWMNLGEFPYSQLFSCGCLNEFETQSIIHRSPVFPINRAILKVWIESNVTAPPLKSSVRSDQYREQGNQFYQSNQTIEAINCYTSAIVYAPCNGETSLSLAHANRAAALSKFGYFKEAYEDCQCALDYGYPNEKIQKIIVRQAQCANKLNDSDKLNVCLEKLKALTLSPTFVDEKAELEEASVRLQELENGVATQSECKSNYAHQNLNDRFLTATKDIDKGEEVMIEKVFSWTATSVGVFCSSCAAQNIIPFPCNTCTKVFYCSLKCRNAEESVHRFECYANIIGWLTNIIPAKASMNTLLKGLPSIVPSLRECTTAAEIWKKIEAIAKSGDKGYPTLLSVKKKFTSIEPQSLRSFTAIADTISLYLKDFTPFFELFDGCKCGSFEWDIVVSALVLRHLAQILTSGHFSYSLICSFDSKFTALAPIWTKAHHLRKGMLHMFSKCGPNYIGLFPKLIMCKPTCVPSLINRFDGEFVISKARHPLKQGAVICHNDSIDYRRTPKSYRHKVLDVFNIDCKSCSDNDSEYLRFHTYRCQNPSCMASFSPNIEHIRWWKTVEKMHIFICPACKMKFNFDWYWRFKEIAEDPTRLGEVFQLFYCSRQYVVGLSYVRQQMASVAVDLFFEARQRGLPIARDVIKLIEEALNYQLSVLEQQYNVECLFYVGAATYAMDLMAQGECFDFNCKKINDSLKSLPEELRIVFTNYIDDYLRDRFSF